MPESERQPIGLHLAWLLSVAIAGAFVTALIVATGDLATLWPLYIVPVVIASLGYNVPGAIVSVALASAVVALLAYGAGYPSPPLPALMIGMVAYGFSGIVIGVQTQRYRHQRQQLEQDATRDPVTGSYRADFFSARLREETRRSARYDQNFALSLVRLMGFEDFQHLYGRVKADLLLERLATVLELTVRSTDLVGRLDSALFAVIMPSTTEDEARAVADRLVAAVAAAEFEGDALEPVVHRSAQVVSVAYPGDAADGEALLAAARTRLDAETPDSAEETSEASRLGIPTVGDVPS